MFERFHISTERGFYNGNGKFVQVLSLAKSFSENKALALSREAIQLYAVNSASLHRV